MTYLGKTISVLGILVAGSLPAAALDLGVNASLGNGGLNASVGVGLGHAVSANANVGVGSSANGGSGGLASATANASVGGSSGVNANADVGVGGSRGVSASADVGVGHSIGVGADVGIGGHDTGGSGSGGTGSGGTGSGGGLASNGGTGGGTGGGSTGGSGASGGQTGKNGLVLVSFGANGNGDNGGVSPDVAQLYIGKIILSSDHKILGVVQGIKGWHNSNLVLSVEVNPKLDLEPKIVLVEVRNRKVGGESISLSMTARRFVDMFTG